MAFLTGGPDTIAGNLRSHYSSSEERWKALYAAGAIGVISIPNPKSMEIPWSRQVLSWGMPRMALADPKTEHRRRASSSAQLGILQRRMTCLAGSGHTFEEVLAAAEAGKPLPHFSLAVEGEGNGGDFAAASCVEKHCWAFETAPTQHCAMQYVVVSAHLDHLGVGEAGEWRRDL